jgi:hypothetical protein
MISVSLLVDIILQHGSGTRGVESFFANRENSKRSFQYSIDTINSITTKQNYTDFMIRRISCFCLGVAPRTDRKCSSCNISTSDLAIRSCGSDVMKRCGRCHEERYCSSVCQRAHWNSGHKIECGH